MTDALAPDIAARLEDDHRWRVCIQCGDCSGICPYGAWIDYPPSRIISSLRSDTYSRVVAAESIWLCMSCSACTSVCPVKIPITDILMTHTKEELLLAGVVPAELQAAFENTQRYGNPLGESPRKRADWARGLQPAVPIFGKDHPEAQVLWFVGDYPSYHPRAQVATRATAAIFALLGVDYAILGNDEFSDGDSQRLAGERGLFELMAEKNGRILRKYRFEQIITTDPHAYNAFKNEYPALGIKYPVIHYTEFLADRLEKLKPHLKHALTTRVTYHDPCYLGRVNGIYDAPRKLIQAIPGVTLVEMPHNLSNSLCCGGGGGGMWIDGFQWEKAHARTSEWRVQEALLSQATVLAVACPYETPRFEDAVKTTGKDNQLAVKDIAELLFDAIQPGNES